MVGLVIVSHSDKLAAGVYDLANQAAQGQVPLAIAGGVDDLENPLGTDATRVQAAIEAVYSEDGVIVLMDLGSAVISAEMAVELLPNRHQAAKVRLCSAPLVEGAVAAAIQATMTNDIELIIAEAKGALAAKMAELGDDPASLVLDELSSPSPQTTTTAEIHLLIRNRLGLHLRPAAQFIETAANFQATVYLRNLTKDSMWVNAKSFNRVMFLNVRQSHEIAIKADGPDAAEALTALQHLVESNFGETEPDPQFMSAVDKAATATQPSRPPPNALAVSPPTIEGLPASPGIAIGPVVQYGLVSFDVPQRSVGDSHAEWQRLQQAIGTARQELETLYHRTSLQVGPDEAAIFEAHRLILADPELLQTVHQRLFEQQLNVEAIWQQVIEETMAQYRALNQPYMQARATDVADVGQRVLRLLCGEQEITFQLAEPAILWATDLTPSDTAHLDTQLVLGICTELGSATSHSAILARALGIPAVVGLGPMPTALPEGTKLALDGQQGWVWFDPNVELLTALENQRQTWINQQQAAQQSSHRPAITQDGHQLEVVANIGGLADVRAALDNGAEGVGLLRTEFLYLDRQTAPSEEEQWAIYHEIAEVLGKRPFIIRTFDIGGDKPLPYLQIEPEDNPFLGWRGIRIGLAQPAILKTQLRAILRASPGHQLKVMFPMVATVEEVRAAKKILAEAKAELRQAQIPFDEIIEVGIMIEVPAAVAMADLLAQEVDFFSIGTNDLSQYTMAADRTNPRVAELADAFQPAVLRLIQQTIQTAHAAGIWVGLCGELAGNPLATPILLGLELDEFSMSGPAIPVVKQTISQLSRLQAKTIALTALELDSASAIRHHVGRKP